MNNEKIYLGKFKGDKLWIEKHSWDCGWYWGFGYVGNNRLHTHFNGNFLNNGIITSEQFEELNFSEKTWWKILELFSQAYSLMKAAEVYRHGGHISGGKESQLIVDEEMEVRINKDLEKVLDFVWNLMLEEKIL